MRLTNLWLSFWRSKGFQWNKTCPHKMPETCNPKGRNMAKWNRSPGATVWQPGAAPPDNNVHYWGRTVHLRTQKKKWNKTMVWVTYRKRWHPFHNQTIDGHPVLSRRQYLLRGRWRKCVQILSEGGLMLQTFLLKRLKWQLPYYDAVE
jgi:hypothetical protein